MSQKNLSSEGRRGGGGGGVAGQQGAGGKGRDGSVNGKGVSSPSASLSLIPYSSRKSPYIAITLCSSVIAMLRFRTWLFGRVKVFL